MNLQEHARLGGAAAAGAGAGAGGGGGELYPCHQVAIQEHVMNLEEHARIGAATAAAGAAASSGGGEGLHFPYQEAIQERHMNPQEQTALEAGAAAAAVRAGAAAVSGGGGGGGEGLYHNHPEAMREHFTSLHHRSQSFFQLLISNLSKASRKQSPWPAPPPIVFPPSSDPALKGRFSRKISLPPLPSFVSNNSSITHNAEEPVSETVSKPLDSVCVVSSELESPAPFSDPSPEMPFEFCSGDSTHLLPLDGFSGESSTVFSEHTHLSPQPAGFCLQMSPPSTPDHLSTSLPLITDTQDFTGVSLSLPLDSFHSEPKCLKPNQDVEMEGAFGLLPQGERWRDLKDLVVICDETGKERVNVDYLKAHEFNQNAIVGHHVQGVSNEETKPDSITSGSTLILISGEIKEQLKSGEECMAGNHMEVEEVGSIRLDGQLEDGEISGGEMLQECSLDNGSLQISDGNVELENSSHTKCESLKQESSLAWSCITGLEVAGFLTPASFPRYYTRSSVRKGSIGEPAGRNKASDMSDDKKKRKTRKRKKGQKQKQKTQCPSSNAVSQVSETHSRPSTSFVSRVTRGRLSPTKNKGDMKHANKGQIKKKGEREGRREGIKTEASHPSGGPEEGEVLPVPERKKGLLSSLIEDKVGLWTTDAGDDQILTSLTGPNEKKKRAPLTAERKRAKQRAKHRKRAEKEQALGIRRLKLKPIQNKVVRLCQFYIKGKCSKGENCTFSHDTIPRTKSEVCKYFLNRCCLKGDDCPFSHELSSFPCKYFHTRGLCLDGDTCRFSHKPITEEAYQDLLKRVEQERQARQESGPVLNDAQVCEMLSPVTSVFVKDQLAYQELEFTQPTENPHYKSFVSPQASRVYVSLGGDDDESHASEYSVEETRRETEKNASEAAFLADRQVNKEVNGNVVLLAARKAASMLVASIVPESSAETNLTRILRTPTLLRRTIGRTQGISHTNSIHPNHEADAAAASNGIPASDKLTLPMDSLPKSSAMDLLQATLVASEAKEGNPISGTEKVPVSASVSSPIILSRGQPRTASAAAENNRPTAESLLSKALLE